MATWYEGLPDDALLPEADRLYRQEINRVREGLSKGLGFEEAIKAIEEKDEGLRQTIIDDVLKVLLAEEHFAGRASLSDLAKRLKLPVGRLEAARKSMLDEVVGDAAMREYLQELDPDDPGRTDA
ncbi:MAG: hypothetical protein ACYC69_08745 [Thermodesulfovibrionales bacterium]